MSSNTQTETMREVRATFATSDQMQDAVGKLNLAGFDRAEISLPGTGSGASLSERAAPAATGDDAQQLRTLGVSTAAAAAALAAAGLTVATGGAAAPAVAAAAVAGGAVGGADYMAHRASDKAEQQSRDDRAESGALVLAVRAITSDKQAKAEEILRAAGATDVSAAA
jgi:hypothetical protein